MIETVIMSETRKVALWMASKSYATGHGDTVEDMLNELDWQAQERGFAAGIEAAAKEASKHAITYTNQHAKYACIALEASIRALRPLAAPDPLLDEVAKTYPASCHTPAGAQPSEVLLTGIHPSYRK